MSPSLSPGAPLSGGTGLESLRWIAIEYQGSWGQYAKISKKQIAISGGFVDNFMEIYVIIAVRQF